MSSLTGCLSPSNQNTIIRASGFVSFRYEINFSFDAEGKPRTGWTSLASEKGSALKVGSEVPVLYKRGNPNLAKLGKAGEVWESPSQFALPF